MSWVRAVSGSSEDVFDENADDLTLQDREWTSIMKKRVRDGYVDGADAGEDASLQVGFNLGFREGAARTMAVGRLKGITSAICCWCQIEHPEKPIPASVTELLRQISQHEDKITDSIKWALENPPPSVSDVSESMEDLAVKPADLGCCGEGCEQANCCKGGEKMDLDVPHQQLKSRSWSTDSSSGSGEGLNLLLQRCMDVVSELALPQELISHILELRDM